MFPEAAHEFYPPIVAAAAIVGFALSLAAGRAAGVPIRRLLLLQLALVLLAHLGGRLYLLIEMDAPWRWADVGALGYRHPGAITGVVLGLLVLRPVLLPGTSFWLLGDCVAPAIALASAVMRVGCFVVGCCLGTVSTLPWAVQFPPGSRASRLHASLGWIASPTLPSLHVHPLQLYFLVLGVGVAWFSIRLARRKSYDGQVFLWFVALHELGKGALEALRHDTLGGTSATSVQIASFLAGSAAVAVLIARHVRSRRNVPLVPRVLRGEPSAPST